MSPLRTSSLCGSQSRTSATTYAPSPSRRLTSHDPTMPVAPVTNTRRAVQDRGGEVVTYSNSANRYSARWNENQPAAKTTRETAAAAPRGPIAGSWPRSRTDRYPSTMGVIGLADRTIRIQPPNRSTGYNTDVANIHRVMTTWKRYLTS